MGDLIKKAEIVVGIPSYNEAKTISNVVRKIDAGLLKYFKSKKAVIINADNNSPDNTGKIFLKVKTKTPKLLISDKRKGKGVNVQNILKKSSNLGAEAVMIADADLKSITPEWVKCIISPVLKGYDFIAPIYKRDESDGAITKHICYPLIYGFFGYDIRQPIGGEFGFSKKFAKKLLRKKWNKNALKFGVDIFLSLTAAKGKFKIGESYLGAKRHKASSPNLNGMFFEVAGELFDFISENRKILKSLDCGVKKIPTVCRIAAEKRGYFKSRSAEKLLKGKKIEMPAEEWNEILYNAICEYKKSKNTKHKNKILKELYPLFEARMNSYIRDTKKTNEEDDEKIIRRQARKFCEIAKKHNCG